MLANVVQGLCFVHARSCVHRDVKSANILIRGDFSAGLTDFGDAIDTRDAEGMAKAPLVTGSPYYAAPEAIKGEETARDAAVDIFSFGMVLLE